jgi:hypothetical protein
MTKIKLKELEIKELVELVGAASLICKNYENAIKMYDGSINTTVAEYNEFNRYNNIRISLLKEIENRLKNLDLNV